MADEPTRVLVTGATGNQGGAVVDHLLASDAEFDVRGLTRDTSGETAQALEDRGVTMVEGDLDDPETLREPVGDADAVFAVTNFWTQGYEDQVQQGRTSPTSPPTRASSSSSSAASAATNATRASPTSTPPGRSNNTLVISTYR
ncbi:NmrA family NAD(P)-binding protein [Halalkalicoccus salilacus]|uniref:NmrA family NAD(P)-binding protein n=1 Tax=Halalkalicoccus sp. GCM10025704 TaxID=3252662 RepID=UPI0036204E38